MRDWTWLYVTLGAVQAAAMTTQLWFAWLQRKLRLRASRAADQAERFRDLARSAADRAHANATRAAEAVREVSGRVRDSAVRAAQEANRCALQADQSARDAAEGARRVAQAEAEAVDSAQDWFSALPAGAGAVRCGCDRHAESGEVEREQRSVP